MTIKGLHRVTIRRKGKPVLHYIYAWRGGPRILAQAGGPPPSLTPDALAAYQEAVQERRSAPVGTVAALAQAWRASAAWRALAASTRRQWGYVLADIEAKWGTVPLAVFDDRRMKAKIIAWRDAVSHQPRKADYRVQVLSAFLSYAVLTGELSRNLATGIPSLYRGGQRAAIIWEPQEIARWQEAPQHIADAVNLARLTGLRRSDLVALPWSAVREHAIIWQTAKSGRTVTVSIPVLPALRMLLAELAERPRQPGVETVLVNSLGRSWTPASFGGRFIGERDRLGLPDKHLHDLRGTYCTELCRAELTDQQIARIMGWTVGQVATIRSLYVDDAQTVVAIGERLSRTAL
jgi:integrase